MTREQKDSRRSARAHGNQVKRIIQRMMAAKDRSDNHQRHGEAGLASFWWKAAEHYELAAYAHAVKAAHAAIVSWESQ